MKWIYKNRFQIIVLFVIAILLFLVITTRPNSDRTMPLVYDWHSVKLTKEYHKINGNLIMVWAEQQKNGETIKKLPVIIASTNYDSKTDAGKEVKISRVDIIYQDNPNEREDSFFVIKEEREVH